MDPATITLIASLLLKYGPDVARGVAVLFSKKEHTLQDWEAIFNSVKSYEQLDAESKARVGLTATPTP